MIAKGLGSPPKNPITGSFLPYVVLLLVFVTAPRATPAEITSASNGLLANGTVITFETVTPGTYGSLALSGVTFSVASGTLITVNNAYAGSYNNTGQSLQNIYSFGNLTINFSPSVFAFGFNWGASDTTWTLTAFDASNNVLNAFNLPITHSSNAGEFYGLGGFGSLIAKATLVGDFNDYIFVENSTIAAIPEPSTYAALAGLGVLGFAAYRRRRRQTS